MTKAVFIEGQAALFPLEEQPAAVPVYPGPDAIMAPLGAHWSEPPDDRAAARAETLAETGGWSLASVRALTGVGEVACQTAIDTSLQRPDWTLEGRAAHLAGAQRARSILEKLGLPATRAARERNQNNR